MLPHSPPFRNSEFGGRHTELTAASPRRVTGRLWCADAGAARKLAGPPRPGSHTGRQGQPTGTAHFPPLIRRNRRAGAGGLISSRMASDTTLNWVSYFFSSSSSRRARFLFVAISSRRRTRARMISMFTWTTRSLFRTLDSIAMPCSVNAIGAWRGPMRSALEVTNCDRHSANSCGVRTNMKSSGNRPAFLLTACSGWAVTGLVPWGLTII